MRDSYFYIRGATRDEGKVVLHGDYILPGSLEVITSGGSSPEPTPHVGPIKPLEVKWILPPKGTAMYDAIKSGAEGAGFETVEHDDFSYPGPRT